ncbi:MAG: DUF1800 domain-containing protein [Bacteroidota bacterium]
MRQKQTQHFFLRAGFGQPLKTIENTTLKSAGELWDFHLKQSKTYNAIKLTSRFARPSEIRQMGMAERKELQKAGREEVKKLNVAWITEMTSSQAQLREKMAFFWHDHFACSSMNPVFMQDYLHVIRKHALGNFGELLRAVSKSPAMLQYLDNQQNKRTSPNENFAREVMELFTLGRDQGYVEKDISEASRAFTGWAFDGEGSFFVRPFQHDNGNKTFLGKQGNLDGDDIIDILLKQKQTAYCISEKWVRFFVNEEGDHELTERIANELYRTDYSIKDGLKVLFTSDSFYEKRNIGTRIKSPVELIISLQRQLHVRITHPQTLLFLQQNLGQMLFNPPNVSGWPSGKDWVDSSTLMFRMNLPKLIFKAALIKHYPDSFDDNDPFKLRGQLKKLETTFDYEAMKDSFSQLSANQLQDYLLQTETIFKNSTKDYLDHIVMVTSKPDFQLC